MHSLSLSLSIVHDICEASENRARVTECQRPTMALTNSLAWETVVNENYNVEAHSVSPAKCAQGPHLRHFVRTYQI